VFCAFFRELAKENNDDNAGEFITRYQYCRHRVTLTLTERNRLSFSLSGNKPLGAN